MPALKSSPTTRRRHNGRNTRMAAPVPQQTSSAESKGPKVARSVATVASTSSGVRKGV